MSTQNLRIPERYTFTYHKMTVTLVLLALSLLLTSCQTITRLKCDIKNWEKVGIRDGTAGKLADNSFLEYSSHCLAAGAELDKSVYMSGYREGLSAFCTMENGVKQAQDGFENAMLCKTQFGAAFDDGFTEGLAQLCDVPGGQRFGVKGGVYRGTCPSDAEQLFLVSYLDALTTALPQSIADVTILEGKKDSLQSRIGSLETAIYRYDTAIWLAKSHNKAAKADRLSNDHSDLSRELFRLESEERNVNRRLLGARKRSDNMQEMLLKWKPMLDS